MWYVVGTCPCVCARARVCACIAFIGVLGCSVAAFCMRCVDKSRSGFALLEDDADDVEDVEDLTCGQNPNNVKSQKNTTPVNLKF